MGLARLFDWFGNPSFAVKFNSESGTGRGHETTPASGFTSRADALQWIVDNVRPASRKSYWVVRT